MIAYLNTQKLPDALLCENCEVSIGVMTAVRRLGIQVPDTLKIMGIGEVSENIIPDVRFPQICIDHAKCAAMLMDLLDREIAGFWNTKVKVSVMPELLYR